MIGKTNVRKWKTFEKKIIQESYQETEEYIDHYENQEVYVGRGSATIQQSGINVYTLVGTGGQRGDYYKGGATLNRYRTQPYVGTQFDGTTYVGLGWSYTGGSISYSIASTNVSIYRTQSVPVYGTRTVTKYRDKKVIEETWHPWWVRH